MPRPETTALARTHIVVPHSMLELQVVFELNRATQDIMRTLPTVDILNHSGGADRVVLWVAARVVAETVSALGIDVSSSRHIGGRFKRNDME